MNRQQIEVIGYGIFVTLIVGFYFYYGISSGTDFTGWILYSLLGLYGVFAIIRLASINGLIYATPKSAMFDRFYEIIDSNPQLLEGLPNLAELMRVSSSGNPLLMIKFFWKEARDQHNRLRELEQRIEREKKS